MDKDYELWFHLISSDGQQMTYDQMLAPPTSQWRIGEYHIHEVHLDDAPRGEFAVEFGIWVRGQDDLRLTRTDNGEAGVRIDKIAVSQ